MPAQPARCLRRLAADQRGAAMVEFAFVLGLLMLVLVNGVEVARWYYSKMELENATQMAAQAVWNTCDTQHLPANTTNCPGVSTAITNALQSTTLGNQVTQASGSPSEGYYCLNSTVLTATTNTTCSTILAASDYITITANYTYAPMFNGISIGSRLPTNLQSSTRMRLK